MSKCAVTFDTPTGSVPAEGGKGTIAVKTDRECAWTAEPDTPWLSVTAGRSGQGAGTVEFSAGANSDPVARTGGIMLNGARAAVTQAAATCSFTLAEASTSIPQAGGSGSVDVRASSSLCTWTAASDAEWIAITSGTNGKGSASVRFTVAPSTGPPRTSSLTIAGLQFSVTQSAGCTYAIAPSTFSAGSAGDSNTVSVTAAPGCPWTAASNVSWISLATSAGTGSGTVRFVVAPTGGPLRTGTATIAGQTFTVTQSPGCTYDVSPLTQNVDAGGGSRTVAVQAASGCAWTASSGAPWITILSGASGSGSGTVAFTAAATTGPSRSGTIEVAGRTVTVVQGQGCTFALSPDTRSSPAAGGEGSFDVQTAAGCGWTAASNASWLPVTGGASGSGNGTVRYVALANTGPQRTAMIAVGGQTFTVTQDSGCTFSITPTGQSLPVGGGSGSVAVTAGGGCTWTAVSGDAWVTLTKGASGSGSGNVEFTVAPNATGAARSGTITIGGHAFTIQQLGA